MKLTAASTTAHINSNTSTHSVMTYCIHLCLLLIISTTTSCSTTQQQSTEQWPKDIPSRTYFTNYYQQDEAHQAALEQAEYLKWVQRFYHGWELYRRGWLKATEELVITVDTEAERNEVREKMLIAGRLIAPEWAKKKGYRVINTGHVAIWGNSLRASIKHKEQIKILDSILLDVNGLLTKNITPNIITAERYYTAEPFGAGVDFDL